MDQRHDVTLAADLLQAGWRKSAHSNPSGHAVMERLCLQAAPATDTVMMLKEIRATL